MKLTGVLLHFDTSGEGTHKIFDDRISSWKGKGERPILEEARGSCSLDELIQTAERYVREFNDVSEWIYMRRITAESAAYDVGETEYEDTPIVAYRFYV